MIIIKKYILWIYNSIKYWKLRKNIISKDLGKIKPGLKIDVQKKGKLILSTPIFSSRKNVSFYISDNAILSIGKNCFFNENCIIACHKKITIGENCLFGPNISIFDHDHKFNEKEIFHNEFIVKEITIGNNCWIGANACILKGAVIGDNVIIAAGSIVVGHIPSNTILIQKKNNTLINRSEI